MAALFYIIFGEGLILAGISKPRRTRAMNAASGNHSNINTHQSQGNNTLTPSTNPGSHPTPGNPATTLNTNHNPATALNPNNPNPAITPLQNIKGTIQSSNQAYFTSNTGKTQKFKFTRRDIPFSNQQLLEAAKLPKANRLTAAGNAYQKHSNGPGASNPNLPLSGIAPKLIKIRL